MGELKEEVVEVKNEVKALLVGINEEKLPSGTEEVKLELGSAGMKKNNGGK